MRLQAFSGQLQAFPKNNPYGVVCDLQEELRSPFNEEERNDPIVEAVRRLQKSKSFENDYREYRQTTQVRNYFEDRIWDAATNLMNQIGLGGLGTPSVLKRLQKSEWPAIMRYIVLARLILALPPTKCQTVANLARMLGDVNPSRQDQRGGLASALDYLQITESVRENPRSSPVLYEEDFL